MAHACGLTGAHGRSTLQASTNAAALRRPATGRNSAAKTLTPPESNGTRRSALHPACRLTTWREHGLVPGVLASRWVSGAYLLGDAHFSRGAMLWLTMVLATWAAFESDARATPGGAGETARSLIAELERVGVAPGLVGPALSRAKEALSTAERAAPTRAPLLESTALEWAEVARDLARASAAEQASDRLEQDVSVAESEIARLRAAVEQTMARVGRARQELKELETKPAASRGASMPYAAKTPAPRAPAPVPSADKSPAGAKPAPSATPSAPPTTGAGR
jgi:hypothetical protein